MASQSIESQIQARVAQFTDELAGLIRAAAVEAVADALGGGTKPKARRQAAAGPKPKARKKSGRRIRRTMADLNQLMEDIKVYIKANKGQRLEEISVGMEIASKELKRPMSMLLEQEVLRKEGERRGTSYFLARRNRK